jgi:transcription antitermination factor NusG
MLEDCPSWYVFTVPPQKEIVVERIMSMCGYNVFVPVEFRWRRVNSHQKVKKFVPYVLASRYVFVGTHKKEPFPWARIFSMGLVGNVVSFDGVPMAIPQHLMRQLFETSKEAADRQSAVRLNKSIVAGDTVMITAGPFKGHVVTIKNIERRRAKVMIDLFQTAQEVEYALEDLEGV